MMKTNFTNTLKSYICNISGENAKSFMNTGLTRLAYLNWVKENDFFTSVWDYLDPNLADFPEMLEAFRELADKNPLLCAFLLLGRENDYLARKKQAEEYMKQEKKGVRGRKKTSK